MSTTLSEAVARLTAAIKRYQEASGPTALAAAAAEVRAAANEVAASVTE